MGMPFRYSLKCGLFMHLPKCKLMITAGKDNFFCFQKAQTFATFIITVLQPSFEVNEVCVTLIN